MMTLPKASQIPRNMVTRGEIFFAWMRKKTFDKLSSQVIFTFIEPSLAPIG
jgi:hypothetical protein